MQRFIPKRKSDFILSTLFFISVSISMSTKYAGLSFPQKDELSYSTGKLSLYDNVRHTKHLILDVNGEKPVTERFSCGHSWFDNGRSSDCGDRFYDPYLNQEVTIGWYVQDRFLFVKNDMPQMVTLTLDDKVLVSYDDTVKRIKDKNEIYQIWFVVSIFIAMFFYFYAFKKIRVNTEKEQAAKQNHNIQ